MKKLNFLSLLLSLAFVLGLQTYETKHWQDPHEYYILSTKSAVNWDRDRTLYWYDVTDEKGHSSRILSESKVSKDTWVTAKRKKNGYIVGEMVFESKINLKHSN